MSRAIAFRIHNSAAERAKVWREDFIASVLSALVVAGLFVDGWSHLNRYEGRLGSFFTPWHGLLYAAFSANAVWVLSRNSHLWRPEVVPRDALFKVGRYSLRYPFAIFGLVIATTGMLGDIVWHTAFGEEAGVARVIAPFHVLLVLGASLLLMAPLRSAWNAPDVYGLDSSLSRIVPAVISLTLGACLAGFVLQWISPYVQWPDAAPPSESEITVALLFGTLSLGVPVLMSSRQWPAATGAAIVITTGASVALAWLGSYQLGWTIAAAAAGGLAADIALVLGRHSNANRRLYTVAVVMPLVIWPIHFAVLNGRYDHDWPLDLALGTAALAALLLCTVVFILTMHDEAKWL